MLDAKVTRLKVLAKNLDGQPGANANEIEDYSVWYISRYVENSLYAKFTLRSPMDVNKMQLPRRRIATLLD
jgi:phage-related protein